ncbi:hypothetical protein AMS68_000591 [Peltaster fructicola]|uniref:Endoplasmic reticulum junction formation protein lunapark n=1 Tax=Peltaster fructicola TaxID=286661 RepID=A0A6H0XK24_9PEZI|nr:hypothetical protein AMS68_000591 [Peltaster fructicola]
MWPFGREDGNSPKSFEKRLATLADKIERLQVRDDTLRATHRRVKVLFTLYGSFIYILVFLILTLVTGYEKWQATEWTAIAASPVAILAIRYVLDSYFDWREGNVRFRLERATKERDTVIKKLKDAMRYDSTKELLDKYGGSEGKAFLKQQDEAAKKRSAAKKAQGQPQRTGFAPPPTANIPGRVPPAQNALDAKLRSVSVGNPRQSKSLEVQTSESFAPNAYDEPRRRAPVTAPTQPSRASFLDRMLDLIVGEDESAARNRIVLLCTSCRTVNGQAPPGTQSLAELGRWRCATCGAWNGIESDLAKRLSLPPPSAISTEPNSPAFPPPASRESSDEIEVKPAKPGPRDGEDDADEEDLQSTPAASTRSKARLSQTSQT